MSLEATGFYGFFMVFSDDGNQGTATCCFFPGSRIAFQPSIFRCKLAVRIRRESSYYTFSKYFKRSGRSGRNFPLRKNVTHQRLNEVVTCGWFTRRTVISLTWAFLNIPSLKLTAEAPENGWLEYDSFLLGHGLFWGANCWFQGGYSTSKPC